MEDLIIDQEQKLKKIYTMRAIWIGTFLGGPLAAGYLVSENFKALGQTDKVNATWAIAVVACVVILGVALFLPDVERIPTHLIPLIYSGIIYYAVNQLQGIRLRSI